MFTIDNQKDLERILQKNENANNKYMQIMDEGFEFDFIDDTQSFYVGKPIGIQKFCIINFKNNENETRQLCLFEKAGKVELYKGSFKKLERNEKELINRNNIFLYQYIASSFIKKLAIEGGVINNVNIKDMLQTDDIKTRAANIAKALEQVFKSLPETVEVERKDAEGNQVLVSFNLKEFFLTELGASVDENNNLKIEYNDRVYYMKNMIEYTVAEIFKTTFLSNEINEYRKNIESLPNSNISSILNVFGNQDKFINFIIEKGESKDLMNIICDDVYKNGKLLKNKLSLTVCDNIFNTFKNDNFLRKEKNELQKTIEDLYKNEADAKIIKKKIDELTFVEDNIIKSGRNRHLHYLMFAPIFNALNGETGIARGLKNNLKPEIIKFIVQAKRKDIEILTDLIKNNNCDPKKDKGNLIFQYMEAVKAGNAEKQKEIIKENFLYDRNTDFKIQSLKKIFAELGDKVLDKTYFTAIINKILKGHTWTIKDDTLIVNEYNSALNKKVKHEYKVPEITNIAKKINEDSKESSMSKKELNEKMLEVSAIMLNDKFR